MWSGAATALTVGAAMAQKVVGPENGGIDLQPAATEIARDIHQFHTLLLWIITAVTLFVLALLVWVMVRYNKASNPTPKKFTHNMTVEVVWTVVPVIILVVISAFSFPLLFKQERIPVAELTIKATGNTWNWGYSYPDQDVEFISNPLSEEDAQAQGRPYRMAVDEPMYVPVNTVVRVLVTSNDVIHAFSVPSFGIKEDAVPGRVNETWFKVEEEGVYYGFCQELCGIAHSLMPIEVRAVSREAFDTWIASKGGQLAAAPEAPAEAAPAAAPADDVQPAPAPAGQPG
ncbi:MAG: cytochrome c oxidase subunit II [Hyphomonadaceae bacterium]|nr:cytochrome c oxidase subunit II [Hyphomonadaceae bacterium]